MRTVRVRRTDRYLCVACRQKRALYRGARGKLKGRRDHPLCQRCYQSEVDRDRARRLLPRGDRRLRISRRRRRGVSTACPQPPSGVVMSTHPLSVFPTKEAR